MWTSFAESLPIMVKHNSGSREWPLPLWEKGLFFFSGGQSCPGGVQPGLGSRKSTGTTANQNSSFGPIASCPGKSYPCLQNTSGTCSLYLAGGSEDPVRLYFRWLEKSVLLDTAFLIRRYENRNGTVSQNWSFSFTPETSKGKKILTLSTNVILLGITLRSCGFFVIL